METMENIKERYLKEINEYVENTLVPNVVKACKILRKIDKEEMEDGEEKFGFTEFDIEIDDTMIRIGNIKIYLLAMEDYPNLTKGIGIDYVDIMRGDEFMVKTGEKYQSYIKLCGDEFIHMLDLNILEDNVTEILNYYSE